jgi:hypothetical protein
MTFDLEAAKRLAQQLAGDVLNQIERDGSVNRENVAGQLLAGLVLEAARKRSAPAPDFSKLKFDGWDAIPAGMGDPTPELSALYSHACARLRPYVDPARLEKVDYVITGRPSSGDAVHVICRCEECQRRKKLSLCGCEMCAHHSEAAAIMADAEKGGNCTAAEARQIVERRGAWNAQKEYRQKIATRRAMREMYVQDVQTVDVKLWRMENGERVPVAATDDIIQALRGAIEDNSPHEMISSAQVVFPNGRVMSGLELAQAGRTPAQIWEFSTRHARLVELSGIGKTSVWAKLKAQKEPNS